MRARQRGVARIAVERQREPVGADGADQRRAAHDHLADGEGRGIGVAICVMTSAWGNARWSMTSMCRAPGGRTMAR